MVARKVEGLSPDDATRAVTPSGLSPLGVVAHLAAVEYGWFTEGLAGAEPDHDLDDHGRFRIRAGDTVESVLDEYARICERSRRIVAATPSLDDLAATADPHRGHVGLRRILVHMIEETARHAGHLDLMREQIDGRGRGLMDEPSPRHADDWYDQDGENVRLRPGDPLFAACEGGPSVSRLETFPPRLEIVERDGVYVLVDDGPRERWRYVFVPNAG